MNETYTDLEELANKYKATNKLVLIQTIGELENQIKELKENAKELDRLKYYVTVDSDFALDFGILINNNEKALKIYEK